MSALLLSCLFAVTDQQADARTAQQDPMGLLVFTRTAGFRHSSIEPGTEALRKMAETNGWRFAHTEDPTIFTSRRFGTFDVVVFLNTTGDILDAQQEASLTRHVQSGKGFVGIHAASDTEYDWEWYGRLVGAYFKSHPRIQEAVVRRECEDCPELAHLGQTWTRTDEWYDFREAPKNVHVLLSLDQSTYEGATMEGPHPIAWRQEFDGGRSWYCGMGHTEESYADADFLKFIESGIRWAAGHIERD